MILGAALLAARLTFLAMAIIGVVVVAVLIALEMDFRRFNRRPTMQPEEVMPQPFAAIFGFYPCESCRRALLVLSGEDLERAGCHMLECRKRKAEKKAV